uniref:tryptophan--tRNA ligase n=1 Tax=Strongyloides papillosus TaxID=174720 RepID=A0A0N5BUL7_STREA
MKFSLKTFNIPQSLNKTPRVYFTGIQPTGEPHLGNYLGFIKNFLKIQNEEAPSTKILLSVVDLHAISTKLYPRDEMKNNIKKMFCGLIACGVDVNKTILFKQSDIMEHTQLSWILSSCQSISPLQRLPQYKDKKKAYNRGDVPLGLLSYPVLQTADVLLYKATHVPVGEDQTQHMNVLNDMARKFNYVTESNYFTVPEVILSKIPRVKSLRDPLKKMSKSDPSEMSRIGICDNEESIKLKIQKAVTDSIGDIYYDDVNRPGISNLLNLLAEFENTTVDEILDHVKNFNTVQFKSYLSDKINEELHPIRERYSELINKDKEIDSIIEDGNNKAHNIASKTIKEIKEIIGLI